MLRMWNRKLLSVLPIKNSREFILCSSFSLSPSKKAGRTYAYKLDCNRQRDILSYLFSCLNFECRRDDNSWGKIIRMLYESVWRCVLRTTNQKIKLLFINLYLKWDPFVFLRALNDMAHRFWSEINYIEEDERRVKEKHIWWVCGAKTMC